ncbi:hypothetical protein BH09VER1_BH09VER1_10510 [soil metagenome]
MRCLTFAPLLGILFSLCSCSSVSVRPPYHTASFAPPAKVPARIYVQNFSSPDGVFRVDRSGNALKTVETDIEDKLSEGLAERLTKSIAPTEILAENGKIPQGDAWLIAGKFDRVNQGSRALRALVGLGAGGTKIETTVEVYNLAGKQPRKFLSFQTTGGSNAQQGLLTYPDPLGGPLAAIGQAAGTGLTIDTKRTSRMITGLLCEYLRYRGVKLEHPVGFKPLGGIN